MSSKFSGFILVYSGFNCTRVTTISECETAAIALGLSDTTAIDDGENWGLDPPYCYFENGVLKFNPGVNTGSCGGSNDDICICRQS